MEPIEFECDGPVTIRKCPEFISCIGNDDAFWYIKRPLFTMDAKEIGWPREMIRVYKDAGFEVCYWNGDTWAICTPKKYKTAQDAYDAWQQSKDGSK